MSLEASILYYGKTTYTTIYNHDNYDCNIQNCDAIAFQDPDSLYNTFFGREV